MSKSSIQPKLLYFVTEDWVFCSHRLPLAIAAKNAGYDVGVITRERKHGYLIRSSGIRLIPFEMSRKSINPLSEWMVVFGLFKLYRKERPDIVHHVAIKPVIYGSLAARLAGVRLVVNALTGLGWVFISESSKASVLRKLIQWMLRRLLSKGQVILQNPDDIRMLEGLGVERERLFLIRGSGVNIVHFRPQMVEHDPPLVLLAARMLWDKGVGEFVEAARLLKSLGVAARFVLVGDPDMENPASISEGMLNSWVKEGVIEWWGHCSDMSEVYAQTDIVCLPSYREGLPKSLLEAAATGLPIVTTDVPGCREVVVDGYNGLLVPVRDAVKLTDALERLLNDKALRLEMGRRGREKAVDEFSIERVVAETINIYQDVLSSSSDD